MWHNIRKYDVQNKMYIMWHNVINYAEKNASMDLEPCWWRLQSETHAYIMWYNENNTFK